MVDRPRGVLSCVARRWESTRAENWAESSAGTRGKAARSEGDGDVAMPDARRVTSMEMPDVGHSTIISIPHQVFVRVRQN